MNTRILVLGQGGREHALAWRLARDPGVTVRMAPGNPGIARTVPCVPLDETDPAAVAEHCMSDPVDLVVVGPESALARGVADALRGAGIAVFGPGREGARIESSKAFAKEVMAAAGVPTAASETCATEAAVERALGRFGAPHVVKADGLKAGKGVVVTSSRTEAKAFATRCLEAGETLVIEEHLEGREASVIAITDGTRWTLLPAARDYKRAHDGDQGPNTGGMGAWAPAEVTPEIEAAVAARIVAPVLAELSRRGITYRGALYCGLMIRGGDVRVLEFNARFGDPETQAILPLVGGSFATLLLGAANGSLDPGAIERRAGAAVSVALVDPDYPAAGTGGGILAGLDRLFERDDLHVFCAGVGFEDGVWRVRGGRAVHIAAHAESRTAARSRVYAAIDSLPAGGWRCRRDIADGSMTASSGGGIETAGAGRR